MPINTKTAEILLIRLLQKPAQLVLAFAVLMTLCPLHSAVASQSIGFYSDGSLRDADALPLEGEGYVKIFTNRARWYGSTALIELIEKTAKEMKEKYRSEDRLQIADISAKNGGYVTGHGSHQTGLDVDIAYLRMNRTEQAPEFDQTASNGFQELFVKKRKILANFDLARNWKLARVLIGSNKVQRIFVGEVVKAAFCEYAKSRHLLSESRETLRRIRPMGDHDDHMHVRIYCPAGNPRCKAQADMDDGDGCS